MNKANKKVEIGNKEGREFIISGTYVSLHDFGQDKEKVYRIKIRQIVHYGQKYLIEMMALPEFLIECDPKKSL